ncbi:hypothetical protein PJL18_02579 [Paenarthrobacter nicotinovorans]|nr:hypothetical protein [Paenarthrobacter nicotinovorans]
MEGHIVHFLIGVREDGLLPGPEGGHPGIRAAARDEFNGRIHVSHGLGGFLGQTAVFIGCLVPDLPRAVHLIAEAPELDVERVLVAVLRPEVRPVRASAVVGVLHNGAGFLDSLGAKVDGFHDFGAGLPGPVHEFVQSKGVGLHGVPGAIQAAGPVFPWTDPVFPVVAGDEVAAGVSDNGGAEFLDELEDVLAEAVLVSLRVPGFVNPGVDAAAHVLHEGAEEPAGYLPDGEVAIEGDACAGHVSPWLCVSGLVVRQCGPVRSRQVLWWKCP